VAGKASDSRIADYGLDHLGDAPLLMLPTHGGRAANAQRRLYRSLSSGLPEDLKQKLVSLLAAEFSKKVRGGRRPAPARLPSVLGSWAGARVLPAVLPSKHPTDVCAEKGARPRQQALQPGPVQVPRPQHPPAPPLPAPPGRST
jgi:hypothetical protein